MGENESPKNDRRSELRNMCSGTKGSACQTLLRRKVWTAVGDFRRCCCVWVCMEVEGAQSVLALTRWAVSGRVLEFLFLAQAFPPGVPEKRSSTEAAFIMRAPACWCKLLGGL